MISSRLLRWIPLVLFALALGVRLIGLRWGLPTSERFYSYHPDERQMLGAIVTVLRGDLNPHFFNYPSLFIYLSSLVHFAASGFGSSSNSVWQLSHDILFHARLVSALMGALTVPVVFALGREIGGARLGILAALLLCFAPAHVQHSHFATVDVAATLWVALSLWLATRALNLNRNQFADTTIEKETVPEAMAKNSTTRKAATGNPTSQDTTSQDTTAQNATAKEATSRNLRPARDLLLSALCAGLGAATKYNAILVLLAPLAALCLIEYSNRARLMLGVIGATVFGFLVGCPFSVLSFREWWGNGQNVGVAYELLKHPGQGHGDVFLETGNGWWYHATFNLPFAVTAPIAVAALCGFLLVVEGLAKTRKTDLGGYRVLIPVVAFSLLYFGALGFSQVRFLRYLLPLLPALTIFAALFVRALISALRIDNPIWKFAVAAPFLLICLNGSFNVLWPLTQTDPRDQAKAWLDRQPDKPPISVGLADAQLPLWFYTPPLWPQDAPPGSSFTWQSVPHNSRYDLKPIGLDAAALHRTRPLFWVWSEFQWRERERLKDASVAQLRRQLANEYSMRAFGNTPPLQLPGRDFVPHDFLYPNPRVEVWSRQRQ